MALLTYVYRRGRGKKDVGFNGQATWASSVINLVNTSMGNQAFRRRIAKMKQFSALDSSPCPQPSRRWAFSSASS